MQVTPGRQQSVTLGRSGATIMTLAVLGKFLVFAIVVIVNFTAWLIGERSQPQYAQETPPLVVPRESPLWDRDIDGI
jgi:hypothetical protein